MKTILALIVSVIMVALVTAQTPSNESTSVQIEFQTSSWDDALALAAKENKPVYLDISASWCGYCKRMKSKVYTDDEVATFYNANFINVSVDGEVGEGVALAKKYGVKGYPTLVFLNPDGSLYFQTSGYHKSEKFLELGRARLKK